MNSLGDRAEQRERDLLALRAARRMVDSVGGSRKVAVLCRDGLEVRTTDPGKWEKRGFLLTDFSKTETAAKEKA